MKKYCIVILLLTFSYLPKKADKKAVSKIETTQQLGVRNAHMMAYDPVHFKTYLFGGADHEMVLSDLWVLEDKSWVHVPTEISPPQRTFGCLVYDDSKKRMILFGGSKVLFGTELNAKNLLNDTWQFKNGQWKKINCSTAPGPRAEAGMVYDKASKKIVLFGGYTIEDNSIVKLGDTWVLDNDNWKELSNNGPSERHGMLLEYNAQQNQIVLFGGSTIDKQYGEGKGETWIWEHDQWERISTNEIQGIFNPAHTYDSDKNSIISFGGWDGQERTDKTISFANNEWNVLLPSTVPGKRNHSQMIYDSKNKRLLLFGGHNGSNVFGDTWEFIENDWSLISEIPSIPRLNNGH